MSKRATYTDVTEGKKDHIFNDPNNTSGVIETSHDPFFAWLTTWWRPLFVACIAVLAVGYARHMFTENARQSAESASEAFSKMHSNFEEYLSALQSQQTLKNRENPTDKKALEDLEKSRNSAEERVKDTRVKFESALQFVGDVGEPYRSFKPLYAGLINLADGKQEEASAVLSDLKWKDLPSGLERILGEGAALSVGRALVDRDDAKGKEVLIDLVKSGMYMNAPAAIIMSRVAKSDDERKTAQSLVEEVNKNHPEQAKLLEKDS